ncbi:GntR family transcriptional regulator [candidate division KSB1 bacterium]|nr:GntR family transcriptional regulator [candidate division KSB1 bacterium]
MHLPKYYLISQDIVKRIKSGELKPGMKIPSENEIIRDYQVSNTTARKTLQEIAQQGWAYRVKGKGTFVQTHNVDRSVTRILGFSKNMIEAGYTPSTRLLESTIEKKGYSDIINGRKYTMRGPVLKIRRLRYADATPMMLEVRFINMTLCPGINNMDLSRPLYEIYEHFFDLKMKQVNQMIRTIIISDMVTEELFDIHAPTPAFLVNGVTFTGKEMILEMERSIYRGDKYSFSVRAT